jgi:drug/metabolite transporter (DMT)-like permease
MTQNNTALAPLIPISGWIEACVYVFAIAFLSVAYVVGHQIGAHPIAFILYAMIVSALSLLAVTGPGSEALRIILAPQSWLVGIGTVGMEVLYYLVVANVAPALGSLLVRFSIPVSIVIGWIIFARRPPRLALIGALLVIAGVTPLIFTIDAEHRLAATAAAFASALAFNLRGFSAEFHPWNRRAKTVMEKLRISGLIVLVTSIAGVALTCAASLAVSAGLLPALAIIPTGAQMLHLPTILLGALVGGAILTSMAVLGFSAVVKITTENFAATSALTPLATLAVQTAASAVGLIPAYAIDPKLVPAMAVVIAGVLMIMYAARRR